MDFEELQRRWTSDRGQPEPAAHRRYLKDLWLGLEEGPGWKETVWMALSREQVPLTDGGRAIPVGTGGRGEAVADLFLAGRSGCPR